MVGRSLNVKRDDLFQVAQSWFEVRELLPLGSDREIQGQIVFLNRKESLHGQ